MAPAARLQMGAVKSPVPDRMPPSAASPGCGALLCAALVALLLLAVWILAPRVAPPRRDGFYTSAAREEPTRSYTPYTGEVARGAWGAAPWGVEFAPATCRAGAAAGPNPHEYRGGSWTAAGAAGPPLYGTEDPRAPPLPL